MSRHEQLNASPKRVIIASQDQRQVAHLKASVGQYGDFKVVATTTDLMQTYAAVEDSPPAAVLVSSFIARLPEFEVMRGLFQSMDVRWLVVGDRSDTRGHQSNPLGGLPSGSDLFEIPEAAGAHEIIVQLRALTRGAARSSVKPPQPVRPTNRYDRIVLIGASTGGIDALLDVLKNFPPDCPPTAIVQHTGAGFGQSLANLLDRQCAPDVRLVKGAASMRQGQVLIGAGNKAHLVFAGKTPQDMRLLDGPPVQGHAPSIDRLFASAEPFSKKVAAALLTGMGRDGAGGLRTLRVAGARTIAQDEATSVVYGMPKAAMELGAADKCLPLKDIGPALLAACRSNPTRPRETTQ